MRRDTMLDLPFERWTLDAALTERARRTPDAPFVRMVDGPPRSYADMLAEANRDRDEEDRALLCVDGVHGFGALADGVDELGCDFLATGTHKWLFGPRGTGILWGRVWEALAPVIPGFGRASFEAWQRGAGPAATTAELAMPGGYKAFEHRWAMTQAFNFQTMIEDLTALPMAMPLVSAFVVFPTASRSARIWRARL